MCMNKEKIDNFNINTIADDLFKAVSIVFDSLESIKITN